MTTLSEADIERNAMAIPADARLRLAAKLLSSVQGSARVRLSEQEALELAKKRADELDSGKVQSLDYREEMERIRSSLIR